jgi:hypothetical protein
MGRREEGMEGGEGEREGYVRRDKMRAQDMK